MDSSEEQAAIEKDFIQSWDSMEQFFITYLMAERYKPLSNLIHELRAKGYDKHFRAGQSLDAFIISRARKHGLRAGQPALMMYLNLEEGGFVLNYYENDVRIEQSFEQVSLNPTLEEFIQRLLKHPID